MIEDIKKITETLISHIGISDFVVDISLEKDIFLLAISIPEQKLLQGRENERFEAFAHLIKRMVSKKYGEEKRVIVDINNTRKDRENYLKNKALMMAERARAFKIDVELEPMSSYERMIVHSHLESSPYVKTESVGEGRDRRLVIRFLKEKED